VSALQGPLRQDDLTGGRDHLLQGTYCLLGVGADAVPCCGEVPHGKRQVQRLVCGCGMPS
jgi:hypothetical protein